VPIIGIFFGCFSSILIGQQVHGDIDLFLARHASDQAIARQAQDRFLLRRGSDAYLRLRYLDAYSIFNVLTQSCNPEIQGVSYAFLMRMHLIGCTSNIILQDLSWAYYYALKALECPLPSNIRSLSYSVVDRLCPLMVNESLPYEESLFQEGTLSGSLHDYEGGLLTVIEPYGTMESESNTL
jgi:hypothetical protein